MRFRGRIHININGANYVKISHIILDSCYSNMTCIFIILCYYGCIEAFDICLIYEVSLSSLIIFDNSDYDCCNIMVFQ